MKIIDLIKYEGDNSTFVWKYPGEDFNTMSQLIVHESQEAVFFMNGKALDVFGPGHYTLETQNIPLLRKIINIPTGGESPFHCEVYFINKVEQMAINWGVGEISYLDPTVNDFSFKIGASGEMSIRVADSKKVLTKLVGTENILDRDALKKYFKTPITAYIKSLLPNILRENKISIFEREAYLVNISEVLKEKISREMEDYGIALEKFWINTIVTPEDDEIFRTIRRQRGESVTLENQGRLDIRRTEIEKQKSLIMYSGEIEKGKMDIDVKKYEKEQLGADYLFTNRKFDVAEKLAENEGTGSDLRNSMIGLGIGMGAGAPFGRMMGDIVDSTVSGFSETGKEKIQKANSTDFPGMVKLESEAENLSDNNWADIEQRLARILDLKEKGLISQEDYEKKKEKILNEI